jgi:hypothetical protein
MSVNVTVTIREYTLVASIMAIVASAAVVIVETALLHSHGQSISKREYRLHKPRCAHLYNVNAHDEWAQCMGVQVR